MVYDGTGSEGQQVDVAISEGKITYVGKIEPGQFRTKETIDATGLAVAPGFIDPHTHAGGDLGSSDIERRRNLPFAYQGVTTVVVGNDGNGSSKIADQAELAEKKRIGTNVAYLVGFGYLRKTVMGDENRSPSRIELQQMKAMMTSAMCTGAFGLSAGLYYTPQNFATTAEVVELANIAGAHGGYYDTHMRDESTYNIGLSGAVNEALEIGKRSGAAVHISHIKALGPAVWGHSAKIIKRIEKARASGQKVTADQYPWAASGTRISNALVPRWALDGGLDGLRERLHDETTTIKIKSEMVENLKRRGGADKLLITGSLGNANATAGLTLAKIAKVKNLDPIEAAIAILMSGDARVASFNMNSDDIIAFAGRDWVVTGSDGSTGHPRKYGSFPKAYRDFVVDGKLMTMAQFVRRSSGQTADIIGLKDRGYLKPGMVADIVIFDPKRFAPRATYQQPRELGSGVEYLLVNGKTLIFQGEHTDELPGKPLLKETKC
ncbi:MAG: amidohydrolase family protein [Parasphingorhabdus sp.]